MAKLQFMGLRRFRMTNSWGQFKNARALCYCWFRRYQSNSVQRSNKCLLLHASASVGLGTMHKSGTATSNLSGLTSDFEIVGDKSMSASGVASLDSTPTAAQQQPDEGYDEAGQDHEEEIEEEIEEIVEEEEVHEQHAVRSEEAPAKQSIMQAPASQSLEEEQELLPQRQSEGDETFAALKALEAKMIDKLSSFKSQGLMSVLSNAQHATVSEATNNLNKLATAWSGVSSWFGSETPKSTPGGKLDTTTSVNLRDELQTTFGLDDTEQVVESFKCKLIQHITDHHLLFHVQEKGKEQAIKVPLTAIKTATRQKAAQSGDVLKLVFNVTAAETSNLAQGAGQQYVAFRDFDSNGSMDSALALIEHLMSPDS